MNIIVFGLAVVGGIALLVAWGWLAWVWMSKRMICGHWFTPEQLASLGVFEAAAGTDLVGQIQTLTDIANAGLFDLARAILRKYWPDKPEVVMRAARAMSDHLAKIAVREYPLEAQWLEHFEAEEQARLTSLNSKLRRDTVRAKEGRDPSAPAEEESPDTPGIG